MTTIEEARQVMKEWLSFKFQTLNTKAQKVSRFIEDNRLFNLFGDYYAEVGGDVVETYVGKVKVAGVLGYKFNGNANDIAEMLKDESAFVVICVAVKLSSGYVDYGWAGPYGDVGLSRNHFPKILQLNSPEVVWKLGEVMDELGRKLDEVKELGMKVIEEQLRSGQGFLRKMTVELMLQGGEPK